MTDFFFIAGAQRCGTTYLYHMLAQHPQIDMAEPVRPEPKFFLDDQLYVKGFDFYQKTFFAHATGAPVRGEKSTSYMEYEKVAERIAYCLPSARILFILRNPIERAVSNYRFSVAHGLETLKIEEAFMQERQRSANYDPKKLSVSPFAYLQRGCYMDYIEFYLRYFARSQIMVILLEQIRSSVRPLASVYEFLGVNPTYVPQGMSRAVNTSGDAHPLYSGSFGLSEELIAYLQDYYLSPNARLADFLKQDLEEWN